jgi:Zn/Cd-binding protein ZinT
LGFYRHLPCSAVLCGAEEHDGVHESAGHHFSDFQEKVKLGQVNDVAIQGMEVRAFQGRWQGAGSIPHHHSAELPQHL